LKIVFLVVEFNHTSHVGWLRWGGCNCYSGN